MLVAVHAVHAATIRRLSHLTRMSPAMSSVRLADGVTLPYDIHGPAEGAVKMVVAHGLGSSDPSAKDHSNDATKKWCEP